MKSIAHIGYVTRCDIKDFRRAVNAWKTVYGHKISEVAKAQRGVDRWTESLDKWKQEKRIRVGKIDKNIGTIRLSHENQRARDCIECNERIHHFEMRVRDAQSKLAQEESRAG